MRDGKIQSEEQKTRGPHQKESRRDGKLDREGEGTSHYPMESVDNDGKRRRKYGGDENTYTTKGRIRDSRLLSEL